LPRPEQVRSVRISISNKQLTEVDLVTYCKNEGIPYTEFKDFSSIHMTVKGIVEGKRSLGDVAGERNS